MNNKILEVNINPMQITSIASFTNVNGRLYNFRKDVYFAVYIGIEEERAYINDILNMDKQLNDRKNKRNIGYLRVDRLDSKLNVDDVDYYRDIYNEWAISMVHNRSLDIKFKFNNSLLQNTLVVNFGKMINLYKNIGKDVNESILKNFGVKLLYWIDLYLSKLFINTSEITTFPKFVFTGNIKNQEYVFLYFLVLLGCDVLYLNPEKDIMVSYELLKLSYRYVAKYNQVVSIPKYEINNVSNTFNIGNSNVPRNSMQSKVSTNVKINPSKIVKNYPNIESKTDNWKPLEYEELAKLASSVVMIGVYNKNNECFKTGSGVIISDKGYILTNLHVACEAAYYGIRLEDEQDIYETSEIIKYNQILDLAILRIDRKCIPIPVYESGKELVRGQKVVAIGSPLGLFNSVSDGIISGFRELDDVSMIQFTAPTSHGSSGGALLDLNGNLVGIITAGFEKGQNINLAVDYKDILNFAGGFI